MNDFVLSEVIEKIKNLIDSRKSLIENEETIEELDYIKDCLDSTFLRPPIQNNALLKWKIDKFTFRGESFNTKVEFYETPEGKTFVTPDLDEDLVWRVFRQWGRGKEYLSEVLPDVCGEFEGYIARDLNGNLSLFDNTPFRLDDKWDTDCEVIAIDKTLLSWIKWEDEPVKVRIIIAETYENRRSSGR